MKKTLTALTWQGSKVMFDVLLLETPQTIRGLLVVGMSGCCHRLQLGWAFFLIIQSTVPTVSNHPSSNSGRYEATITVANNIILGYSPSIDLPFHKP